MNQTARPRARTFGPLPHAARGLVPWRFVLAPRTEGSTDFPGESGHPGEKAVNSRGWEGGTQRVRPLRS